MQFIKHFFRKKSRGKQKRRAFKLSASLEKNKLNIEKLFDKCDDFTKRDFYDEKPQGMPFYFDDMVSSENISRFILDQLMETDIDSGTVKNAESIRNKLIPSHDVKISGDTEELLKAIYDGDCLILVDGLDEALIVNVRVSKGRIVGEPLIEVSAIGPQEGFC